MYKSVQELSREQLEKLKQAYVSEMAEQRGECLSYGEIADAQNIPDEVIFVYYAGVAFSDGDFYATCY